MTKGINGYSILWQVDSLRAAFPYSCPEDLMHTVFLNAVGHYWRIFSDTTGKMVTDRQPHDDFILSPSIIKSIGAELESAQIHNTIPACLGEQPVNIDNKIHLFDATTWQDFLCLYSRIVFYQRLPPHHYRAWCCFVKSVIILTKAHMSTDDTLRAKLMMAGWVEHFER